MHTVPCIANCFKQDLIEDLDTIFRRDVRNSLKLTIVGSSPQKCRVLAVIQVGAENLL